MRKEVRKRSRARAKDGVATKRDIQALAMGMAANIDNLAIGLSIAVRYMQKQQQLLMREIERPRRRRTS